MFVVLDTNHFRELADETPIGSRLKQRLKEREAIAFTLFPDSPYIARPGNINAWDNPDFVKAVKATGKKQLIVAGIVISSMS